MRSCATTRVSALSVTAVVGPDAVENLLLGHDVRAGLDEQDEEVERLGLELDWPPRALDTKRGEIDAEVPERCTGRRGCVIST